MPYYKKIKPFLLALLLTTFAISAFAGNSSLIVRSADLVASDDAYVLNADVEIKFSEKIESAISKGFVLNFLIEFQLAKPKKYWFDDEVVTVANEVSLSYHALSRQYLVMRGDQQKAFVRLDEALDDLSYISNVKVFSKSDLEKGEPYKAKLLIRLDTKKLPPVLQNEDEWKMSSQRWEWMPNFSVVLPSTMNNSPAKLESTK